MKGSILRRGQAIERKGLTLVISLAIGLWAPQLDTLGGLTGIVEVEHPEVLTVATPCELGRLIGQDHIADTDLRIDSTRTGGKVLDVDHHPHIAQGMRQVYLGGQAVRLGHRILAIIEQQVLFHEGIVA